MNPHAQAAAAPVGFGLAMSVRKLVLEAHAIKELVALGTFTAQSAQSTRFLEAPVVAGLKILVSGGTQAGKTTLHTYLPRHVPTARTGERPVWAGVAVTLSDGT